MLSCTRAYRTRLYSSIHTVVTPQRPSSEEYRDTQIFWLYDEQSPADTTCRSAALSYR